MRSSLYINESPPSGAVMDPSCQPSLLLYRDNHYGFGFQQTLQHLGIDMQVVRTPGNFGRLFAHGTTGRVQGHMPDLERHIGQIVSHKIEGEDRHTPAGRAWIGSQLGILVRHTLPSLPPDTPFTETLGAIAHPWADGTADDGLAIWYGRPAPWRMSERERTARHEAVGAGTQISMPVDRSLQLGQQPLAPLPGQ